MNHTPTRTERVIEFFLTKYWGGYILGYVIGAATWGLM